MPLTRRACASGVASMTRPRASGAEGSRKLSLLCAADVLDIRNLRSFLIPRCGRSACRVKHHVPPHCLPVLAHMWCAGTAHSSLMTTPAVALVCGMQTQHSCITMHGKNLWFDRPSWFDAQWVTRTRSGCTQWSTRAPLPQVGGRLECSECGSACVQLEPTSLPPMPTGAFCADGMVTLGDEDSCILLPEWCIRGGPRRTIYFDPKEV